MSPAVVESINGRLVFKCPGCTREHAVPFSEQHGPVRWWWNGHLVRPSIDPSFNTWSNKSRCHWVLREGSITFVSDSTHHLAGSTVDLLPVDIA
jgi:hypothetical protein